MPETRGMPQSATFRLVNPTRVTSGECCSPSELMFPQLQNDPISEDGTRGLMTSVILALCVWPGPGNALSLPGTGSCPALHAFERTSGVLVCGRAQSCSSCPEVRAARRVSTNFPALRKHVTARARGRGMGTPLSEQPPRLRQGRKNGSPHMSIHSYEIPRKGKIYRDRE